jgi:CMP-N,N'-diacetyllegionaminic acid synthase
VPGKNTMIVAGKPLIHWSVEQAIESELFAMVAVSSDSLEILQAAKDAGAHFMVTRPAKLATDNAAKAPAIAHCLLAAERELGSPVDINVDLDATSPLRLVDDIRGVVELLERSGVSNVISGSPARRSPYFNLVERNENGVVSLAKTSDVDFVRRQDVST